jgi:hypothetical protein
MLAANPHRKAAPDKMFVMAIRALSVLFSFLILCQSSRADNNDTGTIKLPDGSRFKTTLYRLRVIGQLKTTQKLPYYILSGFGCQECDANRSIYIHSPSNGPMKNEGEQPRFEYPGKETDYQDGSLVSQARMFFGDCLADHPNAAVWFERGLGDDKKWHEDILVLGVRRDELVKEELPADPPKLSEVQNAVRGGRCHELPGIDRPSEP